VEIYAKEIATALSRRHPTTLYAKSSQPNTRQTGKLTTRRLITQGGLPYARKVVRDLQTRAARPDLLHIENRIAFVPLLRAAYPKTPIVLNLHSNVLIASTPLPTVNKSFAKLDALVVNSQYLKRSLVRRYPALPADKVHVIHPGLDVRRFPSRFSTQGQLLRRETRKRLGVPSDRRVLLFVGRFIQRKGITVLLDAFRQVRQKHRNTELWIIGGRPHGTSAFHQAVRAKAKALPVRFLGFIPQNRLPSYYCAADLFVCPSQASEAFGLVNTEAAACGLPVIASKAWGIREAVADGVSGILVENYTSPVAFAAAINRLLSNPTRLDALGRSAHRYAVTNFSWERTARKFEKVYRKL
jgi:spore coat protein SA